MHLKLARNHPKMGFKPWQDVMFRHQNSSRLTGSPTIHKVYPLVLDETAKIITSHPLLL